MRERRHIDPSDVDLPTLMTAFTDPLRLRIIGILDRNGETPCAAIYHEIGISKSGASHHFRVLRETGVLLSRTSGRDHYACLRREELEKAYPGILDAVLGELRRQASIERERDSPVAK
ncbi:helix-turn-helix transcriptional regulator [Gluconacetobacter sp. 1c LMG 22058]|uniref:Helix-turn-helix transcriptional regulator n=3 Tax=Acetobacteraceae TaxID=433 RepID=A0A7W4K282_9PROT|nr:MULTISPECIES: helix-turn-helix domain-containing protein [Acetobacteraceae]MBB2157980.1 helix-turn-helix transcriptional regulator [Gluconacetobacter diazotrophicus]MBB2199063.1 helix-turn-helix transcriptional regulator [Gluconacetobacter dulcium]MBO1361084.1 helix-turn-helix transcriptional regulator [Acetobacter sacchari]